MNSEISNKALSAKSLPNRLKVLNWGKNDTISGPIWLNNVTSQQFKDWQSANGRDVDVPIDFDHCSVPTSDEYKKGDKDIAGYGDPELVENDGLYLNNVHWTPLGEAKARNYKDLSPAVKVDEKDNVIGLHSCALTPTGAVKGLKFYSINMSDYNYKGANPSVKYGNGKYEVNTKVNNANNDEQSELEKRLDLDALDKVNDLESHLQMDILEESAEGDEPYGDVKYADPGYQEDKKKRYPIDTEEHTKAAWSYINKPENGKEYTPEQLSDIKGRIKSATKKFGIEISDDNETKENKTKTLSANVGENEIDMNDETIRNMAAEVGMENETDSSKILKAFWQKYLGVLPEPKDVIVGKKDAEEVFKQFTAEINNMKEDIKTFKVEKEQKIKEQNEFERKSLIEQASRDGKLIPLSANSIKTIDIGLLRDIVANAQYDSVPTSSQLKTFKTSTVDSQEIREQKTRNFFRNAVKLAK